jgi:hypothetical protein
VGVATARPRRQLAADRPAAVVVHQGAGGHE